MNDENIIINNSISHIIDDKKFWKALSSITPILKYFSALPVMLESKYATIADIVHLWAKMQIITSQIENNHLRNHIQNRINIRWQKFPVGLFLVVWTLHPYYQIKGINGNYTANIMQEATTIFQRLFPEKNSNQFLDEFLKYQNHEQPFDQDILWTETIIQNPFRFWKSVKKATPNLSMLAIRLLSLPAASADAERFWSVMASIHTSKRNRLTNIHASKIAKIKWHLITTKPSDDLTQASPIDANTNPEFEINEVSLELEIIQDEAEEIEGENINELDQDITEEILNDLLENITNLEKQDNEEVQNNGVFSRVKFDQVFDLNEINEISINIT